MDLEEVYQVPFLFPSNRTPIPSLCLLSGIMLMDLEEVYQVPFLFLQIGSVSSDRTPIPSLSLEWVSAHGQRSVYQPLSTQQPSLDPQVTGLTLLQRFCRLPPHPRSYSFVANPLLIAHALARLGCYAFKCKANYRVYPCSMPLGRFFWSLLLLDASQPLPFGITPARAV